ncbi:MAG: pyrroline-5-carboxylate reductase [Defluviitaleaceae bacterium]|nr:pyrroline-5-carboxylate reductase [Defluviitaleaceae bacterium]
MACAILEGLHQKGMTGQYEFFLYDILPEKAIHAANRYSLKVCDAVEHVVAAADIIFLAIKPHQLYPLLDQIKPLLGKKVIVSLPVGISIADMEARLGNNPAIIRIVANVNTEKFLSITSICCNKPAVAAKPAVVSLLEAIGSVVEIEEKFFDIFTVIASSAPAFVVKFAESLADAALREGLPKDTARKIIADMLHGTGKMLATTCPKEMTDKICSPGGTTIVGLMALTEGGFETSIHAAAQACMDKLGAN